MRSAHCFLLTRPQACSLLSLGGHGGLLAYSMSDQCRLRVSKKRRANATNAYLRYFLPLKLYPLRYSVVRQQNKQTPTRNRPNRPRLNFPFAHARGPTPYAYPASSSKIKKV